FLMIIRITYVTFSFDPQTFIGANLDAPTLEQGFEGHQFNVNGWAMARSERIQTVEICWHDAVLFQAPELTTRPDVAATFPDIPDALNCGFSISVDTLLLPEEFELLIRVKFNDGTFAEIGRIAGTPSSLASTIPPRLTPLSVNGLPRS